VFHKVFKTKLAFKFAQRKYFAAKENILSHVTTNDVVGSAKTEHKGDIPTWTHDVECSTTE